MNRPDIRKLSEENVIIIRAYPNGGYTVEIGNGDPRLRLQAWGAFSKPYDLLAALHVLMDNTADTAPAVTAS